MKARVIKKAFEEYAQCRHTLESLGQRLSFWGVVSEAPPQAGQASKQTARKIRNV